MTTAVLEVPEGSDPRNPSIAQVMPCWSLMAIVRNRKRIRWSSTVVDGGMVAWSIVVMLDSLVGELKGREEKESQFIIAEGARRRKVADQVKETILDVKVKRQT